MLKSLLFGVVVSLTTLVFVLPLHAAGTFSDSSTGISFPTEVNISEGGNDYTLEATGVSTRKKFVIKVYSIAHYMENPPSGNSKQVISALLKSDNPKQFTMIWARAVESKKIKGAYEEALDDVFSSSERKQYNGEIKKFLGFFKNDSKKNDKYLLRWLPGGVLTVTINGRQVGEINNNDFARAVWKIWFGKKSPVDKARLVSRV